ncbi:MAG TPA: hypothetical protein VGI66_03620 [Streptosporangiaceae bacterium]|jgi:hypothetical protein
MTMPLPQTQVIIDFLTSLGWNITQESGWPIYPGPFILAEPDQSVWVSCTGGPGYVTEEAAADAWSFQALVRGPSDQPFPPESAALLLDQLILNAPYPMVIDGINILVATRVGSPPAPLPVDPADLRHEFTCSYIITTGPGD